MATHALLRPRRFALLLVLAFALAGCGNGGETGTDDTESPDATEGTESTEGAEASAQLEVTGIDYAFEGVPATVEAGTQLTFTNASEVEVHELVLFHIQEGEERSIEELLALPEEEAQEFAQFRGVAVALPAEDGFYPEGDVVVSEPGRYALVCFIPVGADPAIVAEAMQNESQEGPPDMGDGPPHFTEGMFAEFTVE